eukprot:TRINITY_DN71563_c0_g1_i1.p1 TRINITY_DN71563_c0_g1~~TRINITY_DN71563_c0_g1_i1.p1  ORF type:complete len:237 (+),score=16.99 TRINITY_DN71563_c0_g1_i1:90-800(+)
MAVSIRPPVVEVEQITESASATVIRNLLKLQLSVIAHGRGLFPENAFMARKAGDTPITVLRHDFDPVSAAMSEWIDANLAKAIENRWIRKVSFCISTEDPAVDPLGKTVRERYDFVIAFPVEKDGRFILQVGDRAIPVNPMSKQDAQLVLSEMCSTLKTQMSRMKCVGDNRWLSLRIAYDPDAVPPEFAGHSPRFVLRTVPASEMKAFGSANPNRMVPVSDFRSRFHVCKVRRYRF